MKNYTVVISKHWYVFLISFVGELLVENIELDCDGLVSVCA